MKDGITRIVAAVFILALALGLIAEGFKVFAQVREPILSLRLNQSTFRPGDGLLLSVMLDSGGSREVVDAYVGLVLPDGGLFFLAAGLSNFRSELSALASGFTLFDLPNPATILSFTFGPGATLPAGLGQQPEGQYNFAAVLTRAGTNPLDRANWASQLVLAPFNFQAAQAGPPISYSAQVQPIFDSICTDCHFGSSPSGSLNLERGRSYGMLVNVRSVEVGPDLRVNPGNPSPGRGGSYLVEKISQDRPRIGGRMPLGRTPLPQASIQLIIDWISQGAQNN